jgi:RimJ/RimL family protein N-acetyltransferase
MMVPEIDTERLRLRRFSPGDFTPFAAMWADPDVVRYIGGKPRNGPESWSAFLRYQGTWPIFGYGFWSILDRAGSYCGCLGFMHARRGFADLDGMPECGWVLARAEWGKGYGPEAVAAVHRWFDAQSFGPSFVMIESAHAASLHIAAGVGYLPGRCDLYEGAEMQILLRRPRRSCEAPAAGR